MKFFAPLAAVVAGASVVSAQTSLCDKYTTALLMNNTAENQATVLTLVVNTALIGNYTNPAGPAKNAVTGILTANGTYNGTSVNLVKYFDGSLMSTNVNGEAKAVSFLDGGGATPLMANMPANDTTSNQYTLVTHLYQLFSALLGCSMYTATGGVGAYGGSLSMSEVHRYMNIDNAEEGYFVQEVGLAATSFGVSTADATAVGTALTGLFSKRCAEPVALVPGAAMNYSQSICVAADCPLAMPNNCTQSPMNFGNGTNNVEPMAAASSTSSSGGSSGGSDGAAGIIINAAGALALAAAGLVAVGL